MSEQTQQQIDAEIKALEGCKAYIPHFTAFNDDNFHKLDLQIEYLRGEIDITADEFEEDYDDYEKSAIFEAQAWREGDTDESPSSGWDSWKPKKKKAG